MRPICLAAHEKPVLAVKINRDGDLLFTASMDKSIMLWYTNNGERIGTYDGHQGAVYDCDVDYKSKRLLSACADASVKLWDVLTGKCLMTFKEEDDHQPRRKVAWHYDQETFFYTTMRFKINGRIVIQKCGNDPSNPPPPEMIITRESKKNIIDAIWGPKCQTIITVDDEGFLIQYGVKTGKEIKRIQHSEGTVTEITGIVYSHDKTKIAVCGRDKMVKLYESKNLTVVNEYQATKPLNHVALHPRLPIIMACGGEKAIDVALTSASKGQFEVQFFHLIYKVLIGEVQTGHYSPLRVCTFSPDGEFFVTGSEEGNCRIFKFDSNFTEKFQSAFGTSIS